jgi:hypothetical protein
MIWNRFNFGLRPERHAAPLCVCAWRCGRRSHPPRRHRELGGSRVVRDPSRFDTMPSRPILQACQKIVAPSSLVCAPRTTSMREKLRWRLSRQQALSGKKNGTTPASSGDRLSLTKL